MAEIKDLVRALRRTQARAVEQGVRVGEEALAAVEPDRAEALTLQALSEGGRAAEPPAE